MRAKLLMLGSIACVLGFMAYANAHAEEPKADTVLAKIQSEALKMKSHKDYVQGFCDGIRASNWEEASQHGWAGIPEDALMPPMVTFPDKTVFNCRKDK